MRPLFARNTLWAYPLFGGIGASFGYYLEGLTRRQREILNERKERLIEKRKRREERERLTGVEGQVDGAMQDEMAEDAKKKVIRGTTWGN